MKISLSLKIIVCGLLCMFPVHIKGQTCQCTYRDGGECKSCQVGCYLTSGGWCLGCQPNCVSCPQARYCDVCKTGYYGPRCDHDCNTCRNGSCTNNVCTYGCADGYYYNDYCRPCLYKCVTCNGYTDCTSCIAGRTGSYCQYCKVGYYLNNGQCIKCNTNCLHGKCNVYHGECTHGCKNGWSGRKCQDACVKTCASCERYDTATCNYCPFGHYGTSCESKCSSNCAANDGARQCSKTNGDCNSGCVDGWTGSKCMEICDRQNGTARISCKPGYYGPNCNIECSKHCAHVSNASRQCQHADGTCLDDCVTGYKGDTCDVPCDAGCRSICDRNIGVCQQCKPTFFGPSCQNLCNVTCYDPGNGSNVCHQLSGECLFDCSQLLCFLDGQTSGNQGNGVVIGAAVGSAVIVLIIVPVLVFIFIKRRRRNEADPERSVSYENVPIDNDNYTTLTPSQGRVPNGEDPYSSLTPSLGPIYEEIITNDDVEYGELKDYEVPTTSNYYNI